MQKLQNDTVLQRSSITSYENFWEYIIRRLVKHLDKACKYGAPST
jgi:hypothetical protein